MLYRVNVLTFWLYARDMLQVACELSYSDPNQARDIATCVALGSTDSGDHATARQARALLSVLD